ncbi:MAG: DUF2530 domain-containing protein [Actinobacteria bacterium HGW-Actinobacteria-2]|nr:MAG: DUF2530 domain-containing protein [Actinobacteria bacterium HGW-Actinobacteria-2]
MVLSVTQNGGEHKPILVQAPVRALDPDGIAVVGSGTVAFAVGAIACWIFLEPLTATGRDWYLWVAITGTVIGSIGLGIGLARSRKRRRSPRGARYSVEEAGVDTDGVPHRD